MRSTEKEVFTTMVTLYCRKKGHSPVPCSRCSDIMSYGLKRIDECRFGEDKPFCSSCTVHCFAPKYRASVRQIMRFSGPRMIFHHPLMALKHALRIR